MVNFTHIQSIYDTSSLELDNPSDIELAAIGGQWYLFAGSEATGALSSFQISSSGTLSQKAIRPFSASTGTQTLSDLKIFSHGSETLLVPGGRWDNAAAFHQITGSGTFGSILSLGSAGTSLSRLLETEIVSIGSRSFLYAAKSGTSGFTVREYAGSGSLSTIQTVSDSGSRFLGDVTSLASTQVGSARFLFTASGFDAGIHSYQIAANGTLSLKDSVAPGHDTGFSQLADLTSVVVNGQTYLIAASAGTNGLISYSVGSDGSLTEVDAIFDTSRTRFQDAQVLEGFTFEGHTLLLAAGSDDGLTLLQIVSGGRFRIVTVLEDTFDIALANISDVETRLINNKLQIFVSSAADDALSVFDLDLTGIGALIEGSPNDDNLSGTSGNDEIFGEFGDDVLNGEAGDDLIYDGFGTDSLIGGEGADVFIFTVDGTKEEIQDFRDGIDRIDLTAFPFVQSVSDIQINNSADGVVMYFGTEILWVSSPAGFEITKFDFTNQDFIFL